MSTWNNNSDNNNSWNTAPQAPQTSSIWGNFEEVSVAPQRNAYIPSGLDCDAEIIELKVIQSVKNNNRPVFVATLQTVEENPARYDWVAKADEQAYQRNIKALVIALNPSADPRSIGGALMDELTGPSQPAQGKKVHLRSETIQTRSGHDFTKVHWARAHSS